MKLTLLMLSDWLKWRYRNEHGTASVTIATESWRPRRYCVTVHLAVSADLLHDPCAPLWDEKPVAVCRGSKAELIEKLWELPEKEYQQILAEASHEASRRLGPLLQARA